MAAILCEDAGPGGGAASAHVHAAHDGVWLDRGPAGRLPGFAGSTPARFPTRVHHASMKILFRCDPALEAHLARPVPARGSLPGWLRAMPAAAFSDLHGFDIRTVKQCPPFVDAMAHGFLMPLACDVRVSGGVFSWDWDLPRPSIARHPRAPLSFHAPAQTAQGKATP